ncbi:MAG: hypothetical protein ACKVPY_07120 [Paracoccaceae bacterium]
MPAGLLRPEEVASADALRVLAYVNSVADAAALAETVGFSEGGDTGRKIAAAVLARRAEAGPFPTREAILGVTGVNPARFTEIVVALSGARPAPAGGRLRLFPDTPSPWFGQRVSVVGQLLDDSGRGMPGVPVICLASSGILSTSVGLQTQSGRSVSLTSGSSGIIRFELAPDLSPPLPPDASTVLQAELSRLDPAAETAGAAAKDLAAFVTSYRSESSDTLRQAVDRLFDAVPADPADPFSPWPVIPIALIALVGPGERTETVAVTMLRVRNWLGGFLDALEAAVTDDRRIADALAVLDVEAATGERLARGIVGAAEAFAGLERGVVGTRIRDRVTGAAVGRFVEGVVPAVKADALVDAVRATGASNAAIAGGGFAVFEAIRSVQRVQGALGVKAGTGVLDGRVDLLDGRFSALEARAADRTSLAALATKLAVVEDRQGTLGGRLDRIETGALSRADLAALEARVLEGMRAEFGTAITGLRSDLSRRIDSKADAQTVVGLQRSVDALGTQNRALSNRIDGVDTRLTTIGTIRPRGPGG